VRFGFVDSIMNPSRALLDSCSGYLILCHEPIWHFELDRQRDNDMPILIYVVIISF
jgi:hypothetical protein